MVQPDGQGGALIAWSDYRSFNAGDRVDAYAQRMTANGSIANGWVLDGTPVSVAPGDQDVIGLVADGSGGVFVAWQDTRNTVDYDVYAQHLLADGSIAPGWVVNGNPVAHYQLINIQPALPAMGVGASISCGTIIGTSPPRAEMSMLSTSTELDSLLQDGRQMGSPSATR